MTHTRPGEPNWEDGCQGAPGTECPDCLAQRALFGWTVIEGAWVR